MAAELVGVAASVIGIVTAALQFSKLSYDAISSFQSQRKDVRDIQDDLSGLISVLEAIYAQQLAYGQSDKLQPLEAPLTCCENITQEIHNALEKCTRHSKDHRESVRTWLKLQYHGKSFEEAKQRLASYKATLSIALVTVNLQDQQLSQAAMQKISKQTDCAREELEDQLHELTEKLRTVEGNLLSSLKADQTQIEACLKSLEDSLRTRESRANVIIRNNVADNAYMTAGADAPIDFNLSIVDNTARNGGSMAAGFLSADSIRAAHEHSASPQVIAMILSMQNGTFDPNSPEVRAIAQQRAAQYRSQNTGTIEEIPVPFEDVVPGEKTRRREMR